MERREYGYEGMLQSLGINLKIMKDIHLNEKCEKMTMFLFDDVSF